MNRQKILQALDITAYAAIINAVLFAILFQYASGEFALNISLWSFLVAFAFSAVFSIFRLAFDKSETEFNLSNKQKVWIFVRLAFSIIMLVFVITIFFKF